MADKGHWGVASLGTKDHWGVVNLDTSGMVSRINAEDH